MDRRCALFSSLSMFAVPVVGHQLQSENFAHRDVTKKAGLPGAGYGMGVAVGDYDNDGYEDLFVTACGGNKLYHNNGDGTFTGVTDDGGLAGRRVPRGLILPMMDAVKCILLTRYPK